jgi:imidazole glycerol-phosphate synthase subunit HisF
VSLSARVIPFLLLSSEGLVKTVAFKNRKYVGDPINCVRIFNTKEVDELVILDIDATAQKREPYFDIIEDIVSEAFMPVGYGGGVSKIEHFDRLFKIGIDKIVVNTLFYENPKLITEAISKFGSQSIVLSLDVKNDFFGRQRLVSHCGRKTQKLDLERALVMVDELGFGEVVVNAIDRDGTMKGYDLELVASVNARLEMPVVALGGASGPDDFARAINLGVSGVGAGSVFIFEGPKRAVLISYPSRKELVTLLGE